MIDYGYKVGEHHFTIWIEHWAPVKGYPDYFVSDMGQVKNRTTGRILKHRLKKTGYPVVNLYNRNRSKTCTIHRLVALAFIPNPNPLCTLVDHIDRNKQNNNVSNLRWCTISTNSRNQGVRNKHIGTRGVFYRSSTDSWFATWYEVGDKIQKSVSYSVGKYGHMDAKLLAIISRREMEKKHGYTIH